MANNFLCPQCRGQRTIYCKFCNDSGERLIGGSTVGRCKECNGTRQHRCDVCGGTGEIEGDPQAA